MNKFHFLFWQDVDSSRISDEGLSNNRADNVSNNGDIDKTAPSTNKQRPKRGMFNLVHSVSFQIFH